MNANKKRTIFGDCTIDVTKRKIALMCRRRRRRRLEHVRSLIDEVAGPRPRTPPGPARQLAIHRLNVHFMEAHRKRDPESFLIYDVYSYLLLALVISLFGCFPKDEKLPFAFCLRSLYGN